MSLVDQSFVLFFLPAAVLAFHLLRRWASVDLAYALIIGLSLAALSLTSWAGLGLALACVSVGYGAGRLISRLVSPRGRWAVLCLAVTGFVGLLATLKYGFSPNSDLERIVLPLGVSILTIQQVAILFAVIRDEIELPGPLSYARHSLFLPQLFAGPIVGPKAWSQPPITNEMWDDYLARGIGAFAVGLAKAAILGEEAFRFVQPFLTEAAFTELTMVPSLLLLLGCALAAYFFISGFCDMAFGIGLMVGIRLPAHVDAPFRPAAASRIWRHWSATLHTALGDALLPGGSPGRLAVGRVLAGLLILGLSVLWHGDANIVLGLTAVVAVSGLVWGVACWLPGLVRSAMQYFSIAVGGVLCLSLLAIGSIQPWLTAVIGLGSDAPGWREVLVHDSQSVWQLVLIAVALIGLPVELSVHAMFDPQADSDKRRIMGWKIPDWSLSPVWISAVLVLLVVGIWRAGSLRDSVYFGF